MSYEDQLIREATGQNRDFVETEPVEPNESTETGEQQGETLTEWIVSRPDYDRTFAPMLDTGRDKYYIRSALEKDATIEVFDLCSAAPELLRALEMTRDLLIAYRVAFPNHFADLDARFGADAAIKLGYAAINKARHQT